MKQPASCARKQWRLALRCLPFLNCSTAPTQLPRPATPPRLQKVIPSTIPGIVLGVLSLVGFLAFFIWMIASCCCMCWAPCCKCCRRPAAKADDVAATEQFIASDGEVSERAAVSTCITASAALLLARWSARGTACNHGWAMAQGLLMPSRP